MMTVVLVLQAADVSKLLVKRQKKYNGSVKEYQSELLEPRVLEALSGFRHFVMMYDDVTDIMDVEYCAYRLSITNNRFYYARDIDAQVEESLEAYRRKIVEGNAESDCIFVFNKETYGEMQESGLNFYEVGPYIIGTKEPLPGF